MDSNQNNNSPGFFTRLKQHHIYRVAAWYGAAIAVLIQIVARAFPYFGWSAAVPAVIIILIAGFPVALVLAWLLVKPTDPSTHITWQRRHWILGAIVTPLVIAAVVVSGIFAFRFSERHEAHLVAEQVAANTVLANAVPSTASAIPVESVAVLPFVNESADQDQLYFSDGLSEDLINALSQFVGLKVISRNSAFQFRDSKDSSAKIGQLLGVAHLLEGSVQRAGDEVRITATLVNASDGSTLWSEQYDKPYRDLFALQDAITQAVADALKAKLLTAPGAVVQSDRPPSGSLDAYTAYQRGIAYAALGTEPGLHEAIDAFTEATRLDPNYVAAYAQLSLTWNSLASDFLGGKQATRANAEARKASQTALALDPDSSLAHQARSSLLTRADMDWTGAAAEAQRALQLAPNDAAAQFNLAFVLATLGQNQRAVELTRQALAGDPRHAGWYEWLSVYFAAVGKLDKAQTAIDTAIALQPGASTNYYQLAIIQILRGDTEAALAAAQQEPAGMWHDVAMATALQVGPDRAAADAALQVLITKDANLDAYQIAEVYALRRDPGALFRWLDRAWRNRDSGIQELLSDPMILRYRDDPRFAAFCKNVGLPTTTDAVAMQP